MTMPPLLALAEGRKPRAKASERAPKPRESKLHADVANLLRYHCLPDWKWRHLWAGASNGRDGAIMKRMGVVAGWPDFVLISPQGSVRCMELKRSGEEIERGSPQAEFRMWCIAHGVPHVVAWTMDDVLKALGEWRCLRVEYR